NYFHSSSYYQVNRSSTYSHLGAIVRHQSLLPRFESQCGANSGRLSIVHLRDNVYLGTLAAFHNEIELCKLSIEYFIDSSNQPPELTRGKGYELECKCGGRQGTHSKTVLTVDYDEKKTDLLQLFTEINNFITKAKLNNKNVLIYGCNFAPYLVGSIGIQYLMNRYGCEYQYAYQQVNQIIEIGPLFKNLLTYLIDLDRQMRSSRVFLQNFEDEQTYV
ncbi:unnamed protein product, partial [Didymodactylos carnosus]